MRCKSVTIGHGRHLRYLIAAVAAIHLGSACVGSPADGAQTLTSLDAGPTTPVVPSTPPSTSRPQPSRPGPILPPADGPCVATATSICAYKTVAGDDWQAYQTTADLRKTNAFWWYRTEDVHDFVDVVPDSTFGKAVRITFKEAPDVGWAPKYHAKLAYAVENMWFRWRIKFSPGFTTAGPNPPGYANSWKMAFWVWDGFNSRGQIAYTNTGEYDLGVSVQEGSTFLRDTQTYLPGSLKSFGGVTTEWQDGEWWEFVVNYETVSPTVYRQRWWMRRLTENARIVDRPFAFAGVERSGTKSPRVRGIELGANRNKNNPFTMYVYWGPWEVVDGVKYPNPWNMPNL